MLNMETELTLVPKVELTIDLLEITKEFESASIEVAMRLFKNDLNSVAKYLGLTLNQLIERIRDYGINLDISTAYNDDFEKVTLLTQLNNDRWNKTKTAQALGYSRSQLLYRLHKFRID